MTDNDMEMYAQTVSIQFRSRAAARRARIRIAPLYHDFRAALSTRMDDNNTHALQVLQVMARHDQKGTFFLNDPAHWWQDGPRRTAPRLAERGTSIPARILAAGSSIGGHTLNHDHLPVLSKNAAFREIMGSRVVLEARTGAPVSCFTFPFVHYESDLRSGQDRADLEEILRRSGYLQLGEHCYRRRRSGTGLLDAIFICHDGGSWEGESDEATVARHAQPALRPLFIVTMHAWLKAWGGRGFPKLETIYRKWSGRRDWWYCNQNQYAAYRCQALRSQLETRVEGDLALLTLIRPERLALMDGVPLTLMLGGVPASEIVSVKGSAPVAKLAIAGRAALDVFHSDDHGPVELYGESTNDANAGRSPEECLATGGLQAILFRLGRTLTLAMRNSGTAPIRDLKVSIRLPLQWEAGVICRRVPRLDVGRSMKLKVKLTDRSRAWENRLGCEYNVAEIDFVGSVRSRLFATCCIAGPEPRDFFARNGFRFLGPLASDQNEIDPRYFQEPMLRGWEGALAWRTLEPNRAEVLDPDVIPITGRPRAADFPTSHPSERNPGARLRYLIWGYAHSPKRRRVTAIYAEECVKCLMLNGHAIRGRKLELRKGANEIRILYSPPRASEALFSEHHYGCYFRLTDAEGQRVKQVRFSKYPEAWDGSKNP